MADGGFQLTGIQRSRQVKERVWLLPEELYIEHGLWMGQVVLGQVVVQAAARRAEVGDAGRGGHAGPGHGDDVVTAAVTDVLHHAIKVYSLQHLSGKADGQWDLYGIKRL